MLVGAAGFEPATPSSQTRCATGLRYAPDVRVNRMDRLPRSMQEFMRSEVPAPPRARQARLPGRVAR